MTERIIESGIDDTKKIKRKNMDKVIKINSVDEVINQINENIEKPFITAQFGDTWREYIKRQFVSGECDVDSIINIAWKQGRRALKLERAFRIYVNIGESVSATRK
jgi:hypothetical protein